MIENIPVKHVNDLPGFLAAISEFHSNVRVMWYRGQSYDSSNYKLLPSIQRKYGKDSTMVEDNFFEQFNAKAEPFLQKKPTNEWEWLFLMQHYGIPTRLLDWSENALIALSFALHFKDLKSSHEGKTDIDAVVWCLDPFELNKSVLFTELNFIPNATNQYVTNHYGQTSKVMSRTPPVAAIGSLNNDRIISQKGVFTIFPKSQDAVSLESLPEAQKFLSKIVIKYSAVERITQDLNKLGFTSESLYPSLESVSKSIVREFEERRKGEPLHV